MADLHGKERADAIDAVRKTLLTAAAGVAALVGLSFTARTYFLSRRGQITDRYSKAVTQLAAGKLEERLGGIFALEHLMVESPRDHDTVLEVLAAFVREHAPLASAPGAAADTGQAPVAEPWTDPKPATDVQAALTVIARRPNRHERNKLDLRRANLRGAELTRARLDRAMLDQSDLRWAQLIDASMRGASLVEVQMQGAYLTGADLREAVLIEGRFRDAWLDGAQLQGADFYGTWLESANLTRAQLQEAKLDGARLGNATLDGAQLQGAALHGRPHLWSMNVTAEQLAGCDMDGKTQLPPGLAAAVRNHSTRRAPRAHRGASEPREPKPHGDEG
ncbi:pentapeptide repeat-containing protein [Micromonospora sp. 4G55]|uniref:pentapeptide repeat-containing protein n=1 Tax=Micromonospora sp. 4G55 TaxID=2806102 RepID=UPI001A58DE52|nr:pentapeptide repeat-containing protein [Micromonospora sp. 4G55]MBM0255999.1 pentapeptide repeat-containing protein [Micromonospora sp. 4G55]